LVNGTGSEALAACTNRITREEFQPTEQELVVLGLHYLKRHFDFRESYESDFPLGRNDPEMVKSLERLKTLAGLVTWPVYDRELAPVLAKRVATLLLIRSCSDVASGSTAGSSGLWLRRYQQGEIVLPELEAAFLAGCWEDWKAAARKLSELVQGAQ
jgi:hypothetical protein